MQGERVAEADPTIAGRRRQVDGLPLAALADLIGGAPRAGSSVTSLSRLSWLSAWRTSVRDTLKMSAIFCSASLVPGIRRRSTIAVVIDSTMRCVLVPASALARGLLVFAEGRTTCRVGLLRGMSVGSGT